MTHYVDSVLEGLRELGHRVKKIGVAKVAETAGLKPTIVKKFTVDPMVSKNSDIQKIKTAMKLLEGDGSNEEETK